MTPALIRRLEALKLHIDELAALLQQPEILDTPQQLARLSQEYARLEPVTQAFSRYRLLEQELNDTEQLAHGDDAEMAKLALEESQALKQERAKLEQELLEALVPPDPNDDRNIFLEIRAGTGGDEAALFAGDLFRMYCRYAEQRHWQVEIISASPGEIGGFKEIIARVSGTDANARLKFESGTHRVQRVPKTESQGRIHTSACTVAILPEVETVDEVALNPSDLRVDTYRASGAGGQHVNRTDSAVRITHLPTGIVVECQDERSQHKNRARAMSLLQARLVAAERERQSAARSEDRRLQVGSGDRSERIRTYNFPQGRVTDHRINLTLYQLESILEGNLDSLIDPLRAEARANALAALSKETA